MSGAPRSAQSWPSVAVTTFYKRDLITRHTGRVVRSGIEGVVAEQGGRSLIVLDFRSVRIIDFSCADEVVAKLVLGAVEHGDDGKERFFLFRGMEEHHLDTISFALQRRDLAATAQRSSGEPVLIGTADDAERRAWETVCDHRRCDSARVASALGIAEPRARPVLNGLHGRRLLWRRGDEYVSLLEAFAVGGAGADGAGA
ncbi:MAG: hypothetical protein ABFS14_02050 [Gemmatimonadota bacterium]